MNTRVPKLYVQRLDLSRPFTAPHRAYGDDVGIDIYCSQFAVVKPSAFAQIHTNTAIAPEAGCWAWLKDRSSTFYRKNLICHGGIIDPGYRGELLALVFNPTKDAIPVQAGDRLFQLIVFPDPLGIEVELAVTLPKSERGTGGIGSTGI